MFTGIIRHVGTIEDVNVASDGAVSFQIVSPLAAHLKAGDSVAVNGACLTVLETTATGWKIRLMAETLQRTNLGQLQAGATVNLEQPMTLHTPLDGHFVQGHVDGVCEVTAITLAGEDKIFTFHPPTDLLPYLIAKGSVALDGVSLTVVNVTDTDFTVSMMPYTLEHTTFGKSELGYLANIEVDMIGKYVKRFVDTWHSSAR